MTDKSLASFRLTTGALLLSAGVLYLGYGVDRTDFWSLFGAFVVAFGGYLALVYQSDIKLLKWLIGLGIVLRVALVFAFPLLSDDVYRFIWDGHLIAAGENPFAHLPAHYLEAGNSVPGLTQELFDKLNSPGYYTIYPPVAQGVFTAAAWLSPGSWFGAAVVMKLFLLACELGSLWVLCRLFSARPQDAKEGLRSRDLPATNLLYYWLNPLIIVEITGNLHFEGAMVFFLLLAYYLLQRSRWVAAAAAMAASVASKLLPLLLLPFLIRRLWGAPGSGQRKETPSAQRLTEAGAAPGEYGDTRNFRLWGRSGIVKILRLFNPLGGGVLRQNAPLFGGAGFASWIRSGGPFYVFSAAFGLICLLFFLPFLLAPDFIAGFRSSLELYQQKFEFNASLYYLARAYGYYQVGWNQIATIGPLLARVAAGGILLLALLDRRNNWASLPAGWLGAFVLYLLCATTVHPWYLSVPIVLCCFTRWRFPLVWSFLIMLTYISYVAEPYAENLWLVGVEYVAVAVFAGWEWWRWPSPDSRLR